MSKQTWFLVGALVLAPAAAFAQTTAAADAQARVDASLQTAENAGIPVSLLERKIAEGKAKGVPMDRIATAVEKRLDALVRARDAMARAHLTSTTEGDLSVGADAVQAGVSEAALAEISRSAPPDRRAVAIAVLTELVALGHASDHALLQVQSALRHGPEALANLRAETASQNRAGVGVGAGVQVDAGTGARVELGGVRHP